MECCVYPARTPKAASWRVLEAGERQGDAPAENLEGQQPLDTLLSKASSLQICEGVN